MKIKDKKKILALLDELVTLGETESPDQDFLINLRDKVARILEKKGKKKDG